MIFELVLRYRQCDSTAHEDAQSPVKIDFASIIGKNRPELFSLFFQHAGLI